MLALADTKIVISFHQTLSLLPEIDPGMLALADTKLRK